MTLMNMKQVLHECQISKSTLLRLRHAGKFPSPVQLSPRRIGFVRKEVENWLNSAERAI